MRLLVSFLLLCLSLVLSAQAARTRTRTRTYIHPGLLHTAADFTRVAHKVKAQAEPWKTGFEKLTNNSHSARTYGGNPLPIVYRGQGSPQNYATLYKDIASAYALSLRWKISGDVSYAKSAMAIVNSWAKTLKSLEGSSDRFLASGLYGYQFANVIEILRTYPAWPKAEFLAAKAMLLDVFYPMNHDFLVRHNDAKVDHYWSNWDLCNMCSVLAIGVVADNSTLVNEALKYFYSGAGQGAIKHTIWKLHSTPNEVLGQLQESGRDQGHAMLSAGLLFSFAQMAYNQKVDLFAYDNNRILRGAEYVAKYNLGLAVPYTTYKNSLATQPAISSNSRGNIRPIWELPYNHYVKIKGLSARYTERYAKKVRKLSGGAEGGGGDYGPNSGGYDQLGYGTLMHSV